MDENFDLVSDEIFEKLNEDFNENSELLDEKGEELDSSERKKQVIAMVKKLHIAAVDIIKLINHYKKISAAGHIIPEEILKQLASMTDQILKTSQNLTEKADDLVSGMDDRIENTKKLIAQAEEILIDSK